MDRKTSLNKVLYLAAEEISYEIGYWSQVSSEEEKEIIERVKNVLKSIMEIQEAL